MLVYIMCRVGHSGKIWDDVFVGVRTSRVRSGSLPYTVGDTVGYRCHASSTCNFLMHINSAFSDFKGEVILRQQTKEL